MKPRLVHVRWEPINVEATTALDDEVKNALLSDPPRARVYMRERDACQYVILEGGLLGNPSKLKTA